METLEFLTSIFQNCFQICVHYGYKRYLLNYIGAYSMLAIFLSQHIILKLRC